MTTLEVLRTLLIDDPTVAGLVGTKVFPSKAPQGTQPPFVVCREIVNVPTNSFTGPSGLTASSVQIDSYDKLYVPAHTIAAAVDAVLKVQRTSTLGIWRASSSDDWDDTAELHLVRAMYDVWQR